MSHRVLAGFAAFSALALAPRAVHADTTSSTKTSDVHAPNPAATQPDQQTNANEEGSPHITVRLGGIAFGAYPPHGVSTYGGFGGGLVLGVTTHFDVEGSIFYLDSSDDARLPVQVVARRAMYVSKVVRPYVGAGFRFTHIFTGDTNQLGFVTQYGTYLWLSDHIGPYLEANAAASIKSSKVIPEIGATAGLALGF